MLNPYYVYIYPKYEGGSAHITKKFHNKILWDVQTNLIKVKSTIHPLGLLFQGCNIGSINSCEVMILNINDGSILDDINGSISKVGKDYIIVSDSGTKGAGYFDNYIINDTVVVSKYTKKFTGLLSARDSCDQFKIDDSIFKDDSITYILEDSCGIWNLSIK